MNTPVHEGTRLGLIVATGIWIWIALLDAIAGQPFQTFGMLGGIAIFTPLHYLLNVLYGIVIVTMVRGAEHEPSLIYAVAFGAFMMEFAMSLLTALLSNVGLGTLAWTRIFTGSLVGIAITVILVARHHPLATLLHHAEEER
jgi:hypothetical protein